MNMNMNLGVDDNLSSSAASSHTPSSTSSSEYSIDFDNPAIANLPRILLMGPRRGGKTSIQRVVFQKMPPHETLFRLEATQNLQRAVVDHTPLCRFTIWDFPGDFYGQQNSHYHQQPSQFNQYGNHPQHQLHQPSGMLPSYNTMNQRGMMLDPNATMNSSGNNNDIGNPDMDPQQTLSQNQNSSSDAHIYTHATALIFVIDAQDEPYDHVLQSFTETVTRAISANPHVAIEVFINKVDGELFLSDEAKYECRRDIMQQVSEELADAGVNEEDVPISYHLTSIYDHSVFEAVSRVVQKLIPQLPTLEKLLDVLVSTCSMEKAYLFDVASKLYISTDSSPVDIQSVELCSDMIDVVLDVSGIYGLRQHHAKVSANNSKSTNQIESQQGQTGLLLNEGDTTIGTASESGTGSMIGNGMEVVTTQKKNLGEEISSQEDQHDDRISNTEQDDEKSKGASDSAYDSESSSVIRLSNGMVSPIPDLCRNFEMVTNTFLTFQTL